MRMTSLKDDYENYLATVAQMLTAEGMDDAATLLREASARIEESGYDNWNGGTTIWTIYLTIPSTKYARLNTRRESLKSQIDERLKQVIEQFTGDWCSVSIVPQVDNRPEWREPGWQRLTRDAAEHPRWPPDRQCSVQRQTERCRVPGARVRFEDCAVS